jgi:hypothetical protein
MPTLHALDLTELPGTDALWRPQPGLHRQRLKPPPELPCDGFASPLGYWFAAAGSWATGLAPLRVEILDLAELDAGNRAVATEVMDGAAPKGGCRVQLDLPAGRGRSNEPSLPCRLALEIDAGTAHARVGVDAGAWSSISEPVLLVIAQFWRFHAIDRLLDELTDGARGDLENTGLKRLIHWRRTRALHARRRSFQALLLDLPDFEGPLTNPRGYLDPGRPVRIFRALAAQLGLDRWRDVLDERAEVVEAVLDSLVESLHHVQALAIQIVLELIIVAVLLFDVGLYFLG